MEDLAGVEVGVDEVLKYGNPYFAVMSNRRRVRVPQSKSAVMLYVGMGRQRRIARPEASPRPMTSMNARLSRSISACSSPW